MPRISKTKRFENELRASVPNKSETTFKGMLGYESGMNRNNKSVFDVAKSALKPGIAIPFELPTRNHAEAFLVQEMVRVCSRLYRGLRRMAGDSTQDENGGSQPFTILVDESLPAQREKIFAEAQRIIRKTKLGLKGPMRVFRALLTGDAIGQPIYDLSGSRPELIDVIIMPTWEMNLDPKTGVWYQHKADSFNSKPIATWDIPNYLVVNSHDKDDNSIYGRPALLNLVVNYRHYVTALEDLYVACRTRAPRRLVHYLGDESGTWRVDRKALREYKMRNDLGQPKTVYTDYYLSKGYEEIEELQGDAQGVKALLDVLHARENVMLEDLGLPVNLQDLSGRHVSESADAAYASTINILRIEDNPFITEIVRKGLLLAGFDDVDIDIAIPPLGETPSVRWNRILKAYEAGHIDFFTAAAILGLKNPYAIRKRIEEDNEWLGKNSRAAMNQKISQEGEVAGTSGSETARSGSDTKKAEERRNEQRRAGKENPSGA